MKAEPWHSFGSHSNEHCSVKESDDDVQKKVKRFFASLSLLSRSLKRKNNARLSDTIAATTITTTREKNVPITNDVILT